MNSAWMNVSNAPTLKDTQGTMVPNIEFKPELKVEMGGIEQILAHGLEKQVEFYESLEGAFDAAEKIAINLDEGFRRHVMAASVEISDCLDDLSKGSEELCVAVSSVSAALKECAEKASEGQQELLHKIDMSKVQMIDLYGAINDQSAVLRQIAGAIHKLDVKPEISAAHLTVSFSRAVSLYMALSPLVFAILSLLAAKYL